MFGHLKDWRRVATRYDRCPRVFMSVTALAATVLFCLCVLSLAKPLQTPTEGFSPCEVIFESCKPAGAIAITKAIASYLRVWVFVFVYSNLNNGAASRAFS